eukprot:TRINITY_DN7967_c0_g2_i1.p1 TRINITY_DN7967_c0_g2~~TRINITY_DN7967_c0_g2_i1.p1  ORF type:complete len:1234 (-),score=421.05 TRINITY_DN7967_c0_g2_i1:309-4010(-)
MFRKNVADVVKGIRSSKKNESQFISQCIAEIKEEVKKNDVHIKAEAMRKLIYLNMLGYDMTWASFHVIEIMASPKFAYKRIGYLGACQSFTADTEVLMLTPALLKKDLASSNQYEVGLAINCLSNIITPDLARDLVADLAAMLNSSRPYVRKKTVLVMYKVFVAMPEALRPSFPRLKERLDDDDSGVVSASVSVICELSHQNPKNYLSLAQRFFKLLTNSSNNWMLIKIVKLFAKLTPLEPRLAKKLVDPLSNIINTTGAKSLLYECIQTSISGLGAHMSIIRLCLEKLRLFVEDSDQNLKYLGLLGLEKVMKTHKKVVAEYKDLVLQCLDDEDVTIRQRALNLLGGMTTKKNLQDVVGKMVSHIDASEGNYRNDLVAKIIEVVSADNYSNVSSFQWYIAVLMDLARVRGMSQGSKIGSQLVDVIVRVRAVRTFGVKSMVILLRDPALMDDLLAGSGDSRAEVLLGAAWLCGEFPDAVADPVLVVDTLLQPRVTSLPAQIQAVFMQNVLKLWVDALKRVQAGTDAAASQHLTDMVRVMEDRLPLFTQSVHVEVQERAMTCTQLLQLQQAAAVTGTDITSELATIVADELNPVAPKAQRKVRVPGGLDLDAVINPGFDYQSSAESESSGEDIFNGDQSFGWGGSDDDKASDHSSRRGSGRRGKRRESRAERKRMTEEEKERLRKEKEAREARQEADPFYLPQGPMGSSMGGDDIDDIPIVTLDATDLDLGGGSTAMAAGHKETREERRARRRARKNRKANQEDDVGGGAGMVATDFAMPEGYEESDDEDQAAGNTDQGSNLQSIDLTMPLGDDDVLPQAQTYAQIQSQKAAEPEPEPEGTGGSSRRHKKGGKHRKGGKEGKSSKRKHKHKGGDDGTALVDLGSPAAAAAAPAPASAAPAATGPAAALAEFDLLGLGSSPTAAASTPTAAPAAAPVAAPAAAPEASSSSRRHKKSRKDGKSSRRSKHSSSSSAQPASAGAGTTASAPKRTLVLGVNDHISLVYQTFSSAANANALIVNVTATALATCNATISNLTATCAGSMNAKLVSAGAIGPTGIAPNTPIASLQPGASGLLGLAFSVQAFTRPQQLKVDFTYMTQEGVDISNHTLSVNLNLGPSMFLVHTPISGKQFADLIAANSSALSAHTDSISPGAISTAQPILESCNFAAIEAVPGASSMYAVSIQGHHVFVLLKEKASAAGGVTLEWDLKCTDSTLGDSISSEIKAILAAGAGGPVL